MPRSSKNAGPNREGRDSSAALKYSNVTVSSIHGPPIHFRVKKKHTQEKLEMEI
jgi:hypothetical protein